MEKRLSCHILDIVRCEEGDKIIFLSTGEPGDPEDASGRGGGQAHPGGAQGVRQEPPTRGRHRQQGSPGPPLKVSIRRSDQLSTIKKHANEDLKTATHPLKDNLICTLKLRAGLATWVMMSQVASPEHD